MENEKEKFIILIGPPGSGKGTQGTLLSERLGLYLFETSKILEDWFKKAKPDDFVEYDGQKFVCKDELELRAAGKLNSPPFVVSLIKEKIKQLHDDGHSIITSGSPRTLYEGQALTPILKEMYGAENISVVVLDQDVVTSIYRNSHRRICELMRHSILHSDEFDHLQFCPIDGSKLVKRVGVGDDTEHIKVRYKEYIERTYPLVEYFKGEGLKVQEFKSDQTPSDLFNQILEFLK